MRKFLTVLAALATLSLTNCGYNAIQTNDEQVKSSWSEVLNQYQRRADLADEGLGGDPGRQGESGLNVRQRPIRCHSGALRRSEPGDRKSVV